MFKHIKNNSSYIHVYMLIAVFLILNYLISFNIGLVADDYSFSLLPYNDKPINNILDILSSCFYMYMNWQGRIFSYFFTNLFLLGENQILFKIFFPIINFLIIYEIYILVCKDFLIKKIEIFLAITILFYFLNLIVLNQTLFWITGWCIYVLPLLFLIFTIISIYRYINEKKIIKRKHLVYLSTFVAGLF